MQICWAKLRAANFKLQAVYQWLYVQFSGQPHTKTVLEDLLQHSNNLERAARSLRIRRERLHHQLATSRRLDNATVPPLYLADGDIAAYSQANDVLASDFTIGSSSLKPNPKAGCTKPGHDAADDSCNLLLQAAHVLVRAPEQVKPAGTETDERAVSAISALMFFDDKNFENISSLWPCFLLQMKQCYKRKLDSKVFVSFGSKDSVADGWELVSVAHGDDTYYRSPPLGTIKDAISNFQQLHCTGVQRPDDTGYEEFEGVPTILCLLPLIKCIYFY